MDMTIFFFSVFCLLRIWNFFPTGEGLFFLFVFLMLCI